MRLSLSLLAYGAAIVLANWLSSHYGLVSVGLGLVASAGTFAAGFALLAGSLGKWVHMGRVNSERRWLYAQAIGCQSVDGTYLAWGPDVNLPAVLAWGRNADQHALF